MRTLPDTLVGCSDLARGLFLSCRTTKVAPLYTIIGMKGMKGIKYPSYQNYITNNVSRQVQTVLKYYVFSSSIC